MKHFQSYMDFTTGSSYDPKKWKSGGFPWYRDVKTNQVYVCLFISNKATFGGFLPQMPKGHPDKGESPKKAGAREASEETGIPLVKMLKKPTKLLSQKFEGETHDYLMHTFAFELDKKYKAKKNKEGFGMWMTMEDGLTFIRKEQKVFLKALHKKTK